MAITKLPGSTCVRIIRRSANATFKASMGSHSVPMSDILAEKCLEQQQPPLALPPTLLLPVSPTLPLPVSPTLPLPVSLTLSIPPPRHPPPWSPPLPPTLLLALPRAPKAQSLSRRATPPLPHPRPLLMLECLRLLKLMVDARWVFWPHR